MQFCFWRLQVNRLHGTILLHNLFCAAAPTRGTVQYVHVLHHCYITPPPSTETSSGHCWLKRSWWSNRWRLWRRRPAATASRMARARRRCARGIFVFRKQCVSSIRSFPGPSRNERSVASYQCTGRNCTFFFFAVQYVYSLAVKTQTLF